MTLPNCHYCGKFVNPSKEWIGGRDVYSNMSCDGTIYYHLKCEPMEKAKTAEEKIIDHLFTKHLNYDPESCCGCTFDHVSAMQEYGQMCAEQARQEERGKLFKLLRDLRMLYSGLT